MRAAEARTRRNPVAIGFAERLGPYRKIARLSQEEPARCITLGELLGEARWSPERGFEFGGGVR